MKTARRRGRQHSIEMLEARIAPALYVWVGGASGNWEDPTEWHRLDSGTDGPGFPYNSYDVATFDTDSGSPTVTVNGTLTVDELRFTGIGTSPSIVPHAGQANVAFRFVDPISSNGLNTPTISVPIIDGASLYVADGDSPLLINGAVRGALFKYGAGTVIFGGAEQNNYGSGGLRVSQGVVKLSKDPIAPQSLGPISVSGTLIVTADATPGNEEISDFSKVTLSGSATLRIEAEIGETIGSLVADSSDVVLDLQGHRLGINAGEPASMFRGTFASDGIIDVLYKYQALRLTGSDTTTRALTIRGPVQLQDANLPNTSFILEPSPIGTTLGGTGTIGTVIGGNVEGTASFSPHRISIGGLVEGLTKIDFGTFDLQAYDQIVLRPGGAIDLTGHSFSVDSAFNYTVGKSYTLIDNQGDQPILGEFTGPEDDGTVVTFDGGRVRVWIDYTGGDGNDVVLSVEDTAVRMPPTSISPNGKTATFLEFSGATVVVTTDKGRFTADNFTYVGYPFLGQGSLRKVDLSFAKNGNAFQGAHIVVKTRPDGYDRCAINYINATGVDLGSVKMDGDLVEIDAGDRNAQTAGLGMLKVSSFGYHANRSATSTIVGKLGALKVRATGAAAGDFDSDNTFYSGFLNVTGGSEPGNAKYGNIGKLIVGRLDASVAYGETTYAGAPGSSPVTFAPGSIRASGSIDSVVVNDLISGGTEAYSGAIWARGGIDSVIVGTFRGRGHLLGGYGYYTGAIIAGSPDDPNSNTGDGGVLGPVFIKGKILGGVANRSGIVYGHSKIASVNVGWSVIGDEGRFSGAIISDHDLGPIVIGGNLTAQTRSGNIVTFGGDAESITVGHMITGRGFAISINGTLGTLNTGGIRGPVVINAFGETDGQGQPMPGMAIGSINVRNNVIGPFILAGYDTHLDAKGTNPKALFNPYAGIGSVTVGGYMYACAIAAGVLAGPDNAFNSTGDFLMPKTPTGGIRSGIGEIVVNGGGSKYNLFEAHKIGSVTIIGIPAPLTAGKDNIKFLNNIVVLELGQAGNL